ncbi:MAG TPA: RNA methyltransferase [Acidobacteria bacterium]|nr:RNA methyltransferase [Acidobacteriota bacterium]
MAYDEGLAQRLREILDDRPEVTEKKMFGGLAFLWAGHMCCGVLGESLMARVGPQRYAEALGRPHTRTMDFTGKSMKGMVFVDPPGLADDADLEAWVGLCETFVASLPPKERL